MVSRDHPYQGANTGLEYDMIGTRLRFFGGTSNHWGGWCRPLDAVDFEKRDKVPAPGWPISRQVLAPYFADALEVCEVATGGLGLAAFEYDFGYQDFLPQNPARTDPK